MRGNRVTTKDGKYDIIVRNNLEIIVVKHGENYLKDGEIEITYYVPEGEVEEETIELYFEMAGIKPYEQFANEYLENKDKDELEELCLKSAHYMGTFEQWLADNNTTREEFPTWVKEQGFRSEKDFVKALLLEVYFENGQEISVSVSNGDEFEVSIFDLYYEFGVTENGSYTFTATGPNGETGEVTIEITNIVPKITSVLAERTSEGLRIIVNATGATNYQFKIDDGSYSTSQTSNIYNYNINYPEAKTTSSTTDPYIPRGFVHTEGTVDTGYVISDLPKAYTLIVKAINSSGGETTITKTIKGSEFVWVPVDNDSSTVYPSLARGVTGEGVSSSNSEDLGSSTDTTSVQYFIDSVNTNGGFYIARYESGMPGNISGDVPVLSSSSSSRNITSIPVSRENVMPWNYIDWNNAKASSESMYNLSTDGIQSQLINSYAWDTVLNWVIASGEKTQAQVITDSTSWGNYYGSSYTFSGMYTTATYSTTNNTWTIDSSVRNGNNITKQTNDTTAYLLATGILKTRNSVKNICDMAGNLQEWTTEKISSYHFLRGYDYYDTFSSVQRASYRLSTSVNIVSVSYGFRVVLCK